MYKKLNNIHMVGIGGAGMSGIAEVLLNTGYNVSGSDIKKTDITLRLQKLGAKISYKHNSRNIIGADIVVVSSAIDKTNPEIRAAIAKKIPVIPRAEMLAELARMKYTIAVAGSHGKTTTSSMIGLLLQYAGFDPTVIIGGKFNNFGSGTRLGDGEFFVAEADESDGSFLKLSPTITVVTNIDDDHLDYYKNIENLKTAFINFINKVPFYGCCILCLDDPGIRNILNKINRRYYTYGIKNDAIVKAENVIIDTAKTEFSVSYKNKSVGKINLNVYGLHNVRNALATVCCGIELEIPFIKIKKSLAEFRGVTRRLDLKSVVNDVIFFDDYGHHPTEIYFTLKTLKQRYKNGRLIVIFQPHRYTRTKLLYKKFGPVFKYTDIVRLMNIYSAGEKPIRGVTSTLLLNEISKYCSDAKLFDYNKDINELVKIIRPGDIVLTLGAGDVWKLHQILIPKWIQSTKKKT
jgi:UDP-N-acetylmuramate--alanine ligase